MGVRYGLGVAATLSDRYSTKKKIEALRIFARRSQYDRFVEVVDGAVYFFEPLNKRVTKVEKCEDEQLIETILTFYKEMGIGHLSYSDCMYLENSCDANTFGKVDLDEIAIADRSIPFPCEGGGRWISSYWKTEIRLSQLDPDTEWYEGLARFRNYLTVVMAFCKKCNFQFLISIRY